MVFVLIKGTKGIEGEMNKDKVSVKERLEFVAEIDNIKFINDSRSTTAEATKWALNQISGPIVLIAGGKYRDDDYGSIMGLIREKVKEVILIGEARERLKETFKDLTTVDEAASMEEAVDKAFHRAKPGDCVLLSPMCPSFDMFNSYLDRGDKFKAAVQNLAKQKGNPE